jgi:hypothetical protein
MKHCDPSHRRQVAGNAASKEQDPGPLGIDLFTTPQGRTSIRDRLQRPRAQWRELWRLPHRKQISDVWLRHTEVDGNESLPGDYARIVYR